MCIFCSPDKDLVLIKTTYSVLLANHFPLGSLSLLAISKKHAYSITDLTIEESIDLMQIIALAINNIKTVIKPEGINVFINEGEIAGQTVPHLHFHIVARNSDDGLENFKRSSEKRAVTEEDLALIKKLF